ncbi:TPA: hypothetical protein EYP66_22065 [Candidatus Poribacteria bacterium]|nr:hypothetical protein [Candidatus Poribacteria bacterium]
MLKFNVIVWALVFFTFSGLATGKVLFIDDFEKDEIGKEPSNWEHLNFASGNSTITIEKDPQNPQNKVAKTEGIGLYIPKVAERENWSDYIWDFDWMWENDSYVGTIYRVEDAEAHFHGSRRQGATDMKIYTRKAGTWAEIASGQYPNENNVWYSHRLIMKGKRHEIYMKERDDETPFEQLKPVVEVENDMFKKGPVGMMGITAGVSYFDNMVVVETIEDFKRLQAVDHHRKLTAIWGRIKNR